MNLCNYNWNIMNLRMLDILEFFITYQKDYEIDENMHLRISRGISEIDKEKLLLSFERKKGTRTFRHSFAAAELKKGNTLYIGYNFQSRKERLFLYWNPISWVR